MAVLIIVISLNYCLMLSVKQNWQYYVFYLSEEKCSAEGERDAITNPAYVDTARKRRW